MSTDHRGSSILPPGPKPGFVGEPVIVMPFEVWQYMMAYVTACPVEVNGFGYVDVIGDELHVSEVFMLKQFATPGSVEVDDAALAAHVTDMVRNDQDPSRMRFQWHSHVNMEAYFSGTDLSNIERYPSDWMVSLVTNKRGEYQARLDVFRPFRFWTPLPLRVALPVRPDIADHAARQVDANVRRRTGLGFSRRLREVDDDPSAMLVSPTIFGQEG